MNWIWIKIFILLKYKNCQPRMLSYNCDSKMEKFRLFQTNTKRAHPICKKGWKFCKKKMGIPGDSLVTYKCLHGKGRTTHSIPSGTVHSKVHTYLLYYLCLAVLLLVISSKQKNFSNPHKEMCKHPSQEVQPLTSTSAPQLMWPSANTTRMWRNTRTEDYKLSRHMYKLTTKGVAPHKHHVMLMIQGWKYHSQAYVTPLPITKEKGRTF